MSNPTQQASAIDTARRIVLGAVKLPRPQSSEAKLLAEILQDAAETIRSPKEKAR